MNKGPNQKNFENRPLLEFNFSPENTPIMSIGPYGGPLKDLMRLKIGQKRPKDGPNKNFLGNRPLLEFNFSLSNTPFISIGPYMRPLYDLMRFKIGQKRPKALETHTLIIPIGPYELNEGLYRVS